MLVICPTSQAEISATCWHDGQISWDQEKPMLSNCFVIVIPGRAKREPGIHFSQHSCGAMDSGQPLRGFRNDDGCYAAVARSEKLNPA
jgi:hypothetical protein